MDPDAAIEYIFQEFDEIAWSNNWKLFNRWVDGVIQDEKDLPWQVYIALLCLGRQVAQSEVPNRHQLIMSIESKLCKIIGPVNTNKVFNLIG
jgi:hypothetical protein